MPRHGTLLFASLFSLILSGCSGDSGPKYYKVTGKVTLDGKPVTAGNVYFYPESGGGQSSYGGITKDGTYEVFSVDKVGATAGRHRVAVEGPQPISESSAVQPKNPIPAKFGRPETSGIVMEVKETENAIDIDLKSR